MTAIRRLLAQVRHAGDACAASAGVFIRDVGQGLLEVSHNTLALVGFIAIGAVFFVGSRADLRQSIEAQTLDWLQARQDARTDPAELVAASLAEPDAISRATALDPKGLTRQQAAVAQWISRRYKVAPEPISRLVKEAWVVGDRVNLDPTLILAIMAVESSFNPFAQSPVGAQGLMQVMTRVHDDKYDAYGGNFAAFDPVTNLRVGAQVLKECIARAGGLEPGLRYYVGASKLDDDGGYASKVLAEQANLRMVAGGKIVAINVQRPAPLPVHKPDDEATAMPVKADAKAQDKPAPVDKVAMLSKAPA